MKGYLHDKIAQIQKQIEDLQLNSPDSSAGAFSDLKASVDDLEAVAEGNCKQSDLAPKSFEANETLQQLIAQSPDRFFLQDRDLRYTWISHDSLFGHPSADLIHKLSSEMFSSEETARLTKIKQNVMKTGTGVRIETHMPVNGVEHYFDVFYEPWKNRGEIVGVAGYVRDITERKLAEIEIRKMTQVVETTPTAIVLTDLEGIIEYVNPGLLEMGGFKDASEILGRSVFEFSDEEGRSKLWDEIIPALNSEGQWRGELPLLRKDGKTFTAEMICALVQDDSGRPSYFMANFYNISDRKHAEEALILDESRLEALLRLNQMDDASLQEITDFALEAGVKLTGSSLGYLAFVDSEEKTLTMHSWSKKALSECEAHKQIIYHLENTGLWGEALRQRKAIITNDYPTSTLKKGLPEGHVHVQRHMNTPLFDKGRIVAVAGVGNKKEEYDDSDVRQLTLLMSGMWKLLQRRNAEEELRRRDHLLQSVASATNSLLNSDPLAIRKALGILGLAADVDRVYILENYIDEKGQRLHRLLVEWVGENVLACSDLIDFDSLSDEVFFPGWYETLLSGRPLQGKTSEINAPGRDLLEKLNIARFLQIPIFIDGCFSAVIGFDDSDIERFWTDNEISILQAFAGSIGEALVRRRTEEALKIAHDELERRVEERTAWLLRANVALQEEMQKHKKTEKELRAARAAADAASRAKSEFLANMSHEIRTPMNAVIGMSGLLLETDLVPEQRDFVETIRSSGDALLDIINDILDFSKIDEGKMEIESRPFDLRACVESSLDLVAAKAAEKGLSISYMVDDGVPGILLGDATRLRQVLANLLSNAVKFTDRGEIAIFVSGRKIEDSGYEVHFAVKDTGIGIPPGSMGKLFQSFSQVDTSTSRKYGGTGLGLAISRRLVEMMGGRIWAESDEGKGSTFHFTISVQAAETMPGDGSLKGKKVLLVVENESCKESLNYHVRSCGMQVSLATSYSQAKEISGRETFDVIILDMQLSGAELLTSELGKTPLITLMPLGHHRVGETILTKPVKISQLHSILKSVLIKRSPEQAKDRFSIPPRRDLRILLAEDNLVNQKVALLILKRLGYRADVVANGLEVLDALKRQPYDIILMDVQMPEMDGLEAAGHIHKMDLKRPPKILAMTAYALEGDREKCLAAGMDGYISKPVQIDELRLALEDLGNKDDNDDKNNDINTINGG